MEKSNLKLIIIKENSRTSVIYIFFMKKKNDIGYLICGILSRFHSILFEMSSMLVNIPAIKD